jgi:hypothetical protein
VWETCSGIENSDTEEAPRMTAPQNKTQDPFAPLKVAILPYRRLGCAMESAADKDCWTEGEDEEVHEEGDSVTYTWTCSGGGFVVTNEEGEEELTSSVTGPGATWQAPASSGRYGITCTINDEAPAVPNGSRDDAAVSDSVDVEVVSVSLSGDPSTVAAGAKDNAAHKSTITTRVTDSSGQPVSGIEVPNPEVVVEEEEGEAEDFVTPTVIMNGSTSGSDGTITGTFKSGNRVQDAVIQIDLNPGSAREGPTTSISQVWLSSYEWGGDGFVPYEASPISFTMKLSGDVPIVGHSLTFSTAGLTGAEWDSTEEIDEDGDGVVDYVGEYVDDVSYDEEDLEDAGYNGLVSYTGADEGPDGVYAGTMTVSDKIGSDGYIDYFVDFVWVNAEDNDVYIQQEEEEEGEEEGGEEAGGEEAAE